MDRELYRAEPANQILMKIAMELKRIRTGSIKLLFQALSLLVPSASVAHLPLFWVS